MNAESRARLQSLFDAGQNPFFMTGAEGTELVQLGYIAVDANQPGTVPGSCRVSITEAGINALSNPSPATVATAAPTKVAPVISEVRTGVALPAPLPRGGANNLKPRESSYPFDQLGEPTADGFSSFHIKSTAENPEPWKAMASNVSAANKRSEVEVKDPATGQPVMETVTKKKLVKGADKKPLLDANGKRQYTEESVTQAKMIPTKRFIARRVNATDPNGAGVRVFRVPLDFQG